MSSSQPPRLDFQGGCRPLSNASSMAANSSRGSLEEGGVDTNETTAAQEKPNHRPVVHLSMATLGSFKTIDGTSPIGVASRTPKAIKNFDHNFPSLGKRSARGLNSSSIVSATTASSRVPATAPAEQSDGKSSAAVASDWAAKAATPPPHQNLHFGLASSNRRKSGIGSGLDVDIQSQHSLADQQELERLRSLVPKLEPTVKSGKKSKKMAAGPVMQAAAYSSKQLQQQATPAHRLNTFSVSIQPVSVPGPASSAPPAAPVKEENRPPSTALAAASVSLPRSSAASSRGQRRLRAKVSSKEKQPPTNAINETPRNGTWASSDSSGDVRVSTLHQRHEPATSGLSWSAIAANHLEIVPNNSDSLLDSTAIHTNAGNTSVGGKSSQNVNTKPSAVGPVKYTNGYHKIGNLNKDGETLQMELPGPAPMRVPVVVSASETHAGVLRLLERSKAPPEDWEEEADDSLVSDYAEQSTRLSVVTLDPSSTAPVEDVEIIAAPAVATLQAKIVDGVTATPTISTTVSNEIANLKNQAKLHNSPPLLQSEQSWSELNVISSVVSNVAKFDDGTKIKDDVSHENSVAGGSLRTSQRASSLNVHAPDFGPEQFLWSTTDGVNYNVKSGKEPPFFTSESQFKSKTITRSDILGLNPQQHSFSTEFVPQTSVTPHAVPRFNLSSAPSSPQQASPNYIHNHHIGISATSDHKYHSMLPDRSLIQGPVLQSPQSELLMNSPSTAFGQGYYHQRDYDPLKSLHHLQHRNRHDQIHENHLSRLNYSANPRDLMPESYNQTRLRTMSSPAASQPPSATRVPAWDSPDTVASNEVLSRMIMMAINGGIVSEVSNPDERSVLAGKTDAEFATTSRKEPAPTSVDSNTNLASSASHTSRASLWGLEIAQASLKDSASDPIAKRPEDNFINTHHQTSLSPKLNRFPSPTEFIRSVCSPSPLPQSPVPSPITGLDGEKRSDGLGNDAIVSISGEYEMTDAEKEEFWSGVGRGLGDMVLDSAEGDVLGDKAVGEEIAGLSRRTLSPIQTIPNDHRRYDDEGTEVLSGVMSSLLQSLGEDPNVGSTSMVNSPVSASLYSDNFTIPTVSGPFSTPATSFSFQKNSNHFNKGNVSSNSPIVAPIGHGGNPHTRRNSASVAFYGSGGFPDIIGRIGFSGGGESSRNGSASSRGGSSLGYVDEGEASVF